MFDGLGFLHGELHLEVDNAARPVQQLSRRILVKERITKAIHSMDSADITKVREPTMWISNMVVIEKPDKLRICMDPSAHNKALLRSHIQMPTIENILPEISNAKVFSVLDAKDGQSQT